MGGEPSDDYFEAAAAVVEAAKSLDEASRVEKESDEIHMQLYDEKRAAEKVLKEAIEKLKSVSPR